MPILTAAIASTPASSPEAFNATLATVSGHAAAAANVVEQTMGRVSEAASAVIAANAPKPWYSFTPDAFLNGFATLAGAVGGALAAYFFQRYLASRQEERQDQRKALESAHFLTFCLVQQINTLSLMQRDWVWPHIRNPARFISIPATQKLDPARNTFTVQEVSALFDTPESRKHLFDLFLAQESYMVAVDAWNLRSALHQSEVQPRLAASDIANGSEATVAQMKEALGPLIFPAICNATEGAQLSLQRAFLKIETATKELLAFLKGSGRFRGEKFTYADVHERWGIDDPLAPLAGEGPPRAVESFEEPRRFYQYSPSMRVRWFPVRVAATEGDGK